MRRDGAANRERILAAAEQVFGEGGEGASTEEVARVAGVGIATVFRHFPTKQELLEAAATRYLTTLEDRARQLAADHDPGPALAAIFRVLVATGPTKVSLLNALLTDTRELSAPVTDTVHRVRGQVGEVLRAAQDSGDARADATTEQVFTLARALAHVVTGDGAVDRAVEITLDGLGVRR